MSMQGTFIDVTAYLAQSAFSNVDGRKRSALKPDPLYPNHRFLYTHSLYKPPMDKQNQRPPRAARPKSTQPISNPANAVTSPVTRPTFPHQESSKVSFLQDEAGQRQDPIRQRPNPSGYVNQPNLSYDAEAGEGVARKKSLVRADRAKIDPSHPQYHYRNHVQQLEEEGIGRVMVSSASTHLSLSHCMCDPDVL